MFPKCPKAKCCHNYYSQGVVVFAIFFYQVLGCAMLVSLALPSSSEKPSIASYILSAVSVLLGLWLSVAAITRKKNLVLAVLIVGVVKLVIGAIYLLLPIEKEVGISDFGASWPLLLLFCTMQHGIYLYYKQLRNDEIFARNEDILTIE